MIFHAEQDYLIIQQSDYTTVPGPVSYHCQQCVEKYLKALLSAGGLIPPRTHDLVELTALLSFPWDETVASADELEALTVFEVVGRYWVEQPRLTPDDAEMALNLMDRIRSFARAELGLDAADEKAAADNTATGASGADQS